MIPQEHTIDETQPREQARSPVSSWRGLNLLLHILGIVVPLVGGFVVGIMVIQTMTGMVLVMGLLGVVGTILLRSLWAVAGVPAALVVGLMLGAALPTILQGGEIELQPWLQQHAYLVDMVLFLGAFALLGASISAPIGIQHANSMLTKQCNGPDLL
jgi:hypothetical protein